MPEALLHAVQRYTDKQTGDSPFATAIKGFTILRSDHEKPPSHLIFKPALCIVVQGAKWALFGDRHVDYGPGQALLVSVEMPAFGRVAQASADRPYLGLVIEFDLAVMREVMEQLDTPPQTGSRVASSVFVTDFDGPLADCALRMVRLLDTPQAIGLLYPAIMREMCYWLLSGPHGSEVAGMALGSRHAQRIVGAIHALRDRYAETVSIEELAVIAQLSPSAFHRQFKMLTSMTPLQYQKQLRLLEARRLMVADAANVETSAFRVGYESASQFSREYARMFGAPPRRDIAALKTGGASLHGAL
ncbi:AraC family transcriptional regulator [Janthinobacterium agaricidamnosum]|uniref:Bacterial regulatory helix-turn-helix s, AraC family protein n=1 Tax=Janthinobacterium agaricidamnosum NBRC 102515 = DSM 9628 TaxID=1349767 RepID=W0V7T9_9BURK|nr:AraC family transcriptional regulator [Janthinobacterium agaricidamnosum]CDG83675.1 bacterial regulatory helix-turn-helix s, AraC family protein [Janthinobacterium agaricidamnosum NBRC 102515 = DSM 9628]